MPNEIVELQPRQHRAASLIFLQQCKGYAVEASPGHKDPLYWNPSEATEAASIATWNRLNTNDNNLGVHCWGPLVDIDVDSDNPFMKAALDLCLPYTPHIWGRKSNPRSHRAYLLNFGRDHECLNRQDFPIFTRLKRHAEVEFRGGGLADGHYSLLPGSIHPSGELYEWAEVKKAQQSLVSVTPERLIGSVRKACAIAELAQFWQEGMRNDLTMALSGFLHRLYTLTTEADLYVEDMFVIDKEESLNFLKTLMKVADDAPEDEWMRIKTFDKTWVKASEGHPVTAGKRLTEISGDVKLLTRLYAILSDNASIQAIDAFIARFAILYGSGMFVDLENANSGHQLEQVIMSKQGFEISCAHHRYMGHDGKSKPLTQRLPLMASATRIDGFALEPGADRIIERKGRSFANLWSGYEIDPYPGFVSDDDVHRFINYLQRIVCNGSQSAYEWVVAWLADIFQNPAEKAGTALVLVGKPGTGKTMLQENILRPMIGDAHSVANNNIYNLTRDFNTMYSNKLLIACDEATSRRQKDSFEKLKTLITDREMRVEPKGKDAFIINNPARFILTSNHEFDAVHLPDGTSDRRYTVLKVSDERRVDIPFWGSFVGWLNEPDTRPKIFKWLLQQEYNKADIKVPTETEARQRISQRTMEVFDRWLMLSVERGFPLSPEVYLNYWDAAMNRSMPDSKKRGVDASDWPEYVNYSAITQDYETFRRRHDSTSFAVDNSYIGQELYARGLKPTDPPFRGSITGAYDNRTGNPFTGRVYLHPFPSLELVVGYLRDQFGYTPPIGWDTLASETEAADAAPMSEEF